MEITEVFKALGDQTRLRILNLLSKQTLCVCQINEVLGMSQPNASKHLNRLRYTGIINCTKVSQWCFYSLQRAFLDGYPLLMKFLEEQWAANSLFADDHKKLAVLLKDNDCCSKMLKVFEKK